MRHAVEDEGGAVEMLHGFAVFAPFAEAGGVAGAQDELSQAFVEDAAFTHLLAAIENGFGDAVDGAREGRIGQAAHGEIQRGIPCEAEGLGFGTAAQIIGGGDGEADGFRGLCHAAGFGERINEGDLPFGRPAIVARAQGDGGERGGCVRRALG